MVKIISKNWVFLFLGLAPLGCASLQGDEKKNAQPVHELSAEEICLARNLAEKELVISSYPVSPLDRIVFIKVDLLPGSRADSGQRLVIVTHYAYRGDEALLTRVDLNRLEGMEVERIPHFPTGLAREEVSRAEELARADERLEPFFSLNSSVNIEARPLQVNATHPLFGHRLVHLLLFEGGGYLTSPYLLVDLTTESVLVDVKF